MAVMPLRSRYPLLALAAMLSAGAAHAQPQPPATPAPIAGIPVNYDEAKVGNYTLARPADAGERQTRARRQDLERKAASGDRAAVRGKRIRAQPRPP